MKLILNRKSNVVGVALSFIFVMIAIESVAAQTCVMPAAGIVSWWAGDGAANDLQAGHDGVLQNGATFDMGYVDRAFALDGVSAYVQVPHAVGLDMTSALTIDAWIQTRNAREDQMIVSKVQAGSTLSSINYYFGIFTSRLAFAVTGNEVKQGETTLLSDTWYHVAVTYDGAEVRFYLNGVLDGVHALTTVPLANVADVEIGRFGLGGTPGWLTKQGNINQRVVFRVEPSSRGVLAHRPIFIARIVPQTSIPHTVNQ